MGVQSVPWAVSVHDAAADRERRDVLHTRTLIELIVQ